MRTKEVPTNHPGDDETGFYKIPDIDKRGSIKREKIRKWIEGGYIEPFYRVPYKRGEICYFAKAQLYEIKLFEHFVKLGVSRHYAKVWVKSFDKLRRNRKEEPKSVTVILKKDAIVEINLVYDNVFKLELEENDDGAYVVNFKKIYDEINQKFT